MSLPSGFRAAWSFWHRGAHPCAYAQAELFSRCHPLFRSIAEKQMCCSSVLRASAHVPLESLCGLQIFICSSYPLFSASMRCPAVQGFFPAPGVPTTLPRSASTTRGHRTLAAVRFKPAGRGFSAIVLAFLFLRNLCRSEVFSYAGVVPSQPFYKRGTPLPKVAFRLL